MPSESNAKIQLIWAKVGGLLALIAILLAFSYLFIQSGESIIPLILFFIAVISSLALVSILYRPKKR